MVETLHIYAQPYYHCDAWVAGNREALTKLRDALTRALDTSEPQVVHSYTNDGEGYATFVLPLTPEQMYPLTLPYTDDETFAPPAKDRTYPMNHIDPQDYKRLLKEDEL